jgi:hypothetical protein
MALAAPRRSTIAALLGGLTLALLAALGTARAQETQQQTQQEPLPDGVIAVQQFAATEAAVDLAETTVLRHEHVIWNNGCMGTAPLPPDNACTLAIVEGWAVWISLDAGATATRYHANLDGSIVLLGEADIPATDIATAPLPDDAAPATDEGIGGVFVGELPPAGGLAFLTTSQAISATGLVEGIATSGCAVETIGLTQDGAWLIYVAGAPDLVNAAFPQSLEQSAPFYVRCNGASDGTQPPEDTAQLPAPTAVTLSGELPDLTETVPEGSGELGRVTIEWTYPAETLPDIEGFRIYLRDCDGTETVALEVAPTETSHGPLQACRPDGAVGVSAFTADLESDIVWTTGPTESTATQ